MFNKPDFKYDPSRQWSYLEPDDVCAKCHAVVEFFCATHPNAAVVSGGPGHIITKTEQEIIVEYYPHWGWLMAKARKAEHITKEGCIEDWIVIHWAKQVGTD